MPYLARRRVKEVKQSTYLYFEWGCGVNKSKSVRCWDERNLDEYFIRPTEVFHHSVFANIYLFYYVFELLYKPLIYSMQMKDAKVNFITLWKLLYLENIEGLDVRVCCASVTSYRRVFNIKRDCVTHLTLAPCFDYTTYLFVNQLTLTYFSLLGATKQKKKTKTTLGMIPLDHRTRYRVSQVWLEGSNLHLSSRTLCETDLITHQRLNLHAQAKKLWQHIVIPISLSLQED